MKLCALFLSFLFCISSLLLFVVCQFDFHGVLFIFLSVFSCFQRNFTTELNVNICTTGHWPVAQIMPCTMPPEILSLAEAFRSFYLARHHGRKLDWRMDSVSRHFFFSAFLSIPLSPFAFFDSLFFLLIPRAKLN